MSKDDQILNDAYVNFGLLKENSYLNRALVLLSAKHSDRHCRINLQMNFHTVVPFVVL